MTPLYNVSPFPLPVIDERDSISSLQTAHSRLTSLFPQPLTDVSSSSFFTLNSALPAVITIQDLNTAEAEAEAETGTSSTRKRKQNDRAETGTNTPRVSPRRVDMTESIEKMNEIKEQCLQEIERIESLELAAKDKRRLIKNLTLARSALFENIKLIEDPSNVKPAKRRRVIRASSVNRVARECFFCNTNDTTQWRFVTVDGIKKDACNACGLRNNKKKPISKE